MKTTIQDVTKFFLQRYRAICGRAEIEPSDTQARDVAYRLAVGLHALDSETREIVARAYVDGEAMQEIANSMALSLSTAKRKAAAGLRQAAIAAFGF